MPRAPVSLPSHMQQEIATLRETRTNLEKEVEQYLANIAGEKKLQEEVAAAKAADVARLEALLAEARKNAEDAKAQLAKENTMHAEAAVQARKDASAWVKKELSEGVEKKAQEIINNLQRESKRLEALSVEDEKKAGSTEAKQAQAEKVQEDAEAKLAAAKKDAETAGVGDPDALEAMRNKVDAATAAANAAEEENLSLKEKAERVAELEAEIKDLKHRIASAPKIDPVELQKLREKKKRIESVDMDEVESLRETVAKLPALEARVKELRKEAEEAMKVDTTERDSLREKVAKGQVPLPAPPPVNTAQLKEIEELKEQVEKIPALEAEAASLKKQIEAKTASNEAELEELRKKARDNAVAAAAANAAAAAALAPPPTESPEIVALRTQAKKATDLEAEIATLKLQVAKLTGLELENQRLRQQIASRPPPPAYSTPPPPGYGGYQPHPPPGGGWY